MSDQLDIGKLRALEAKATPAPWEAWEKEHTRGDVVIGVTWSVVCNHYTDETPAVFGDDGFWPVTEDDAEFVSALRNAAPALLDAAEENAKLREQLGEQQRENEKIIAENMSIRSDLISMLDSAKRDRDEIRWAAEREEERLRSNIDGAFDERDRLAKRVESLDKQAAELYAREGDALALYADVVRLLERVTAERDALRAEVTRLDAGWKECLDALQIAKDAMLRAGAARDSYFAEAAKLRAENERLREALRSVDKELELSEYTEEGFLRSCVRAAIRHTDEVKP